MPELDSLFARLRAALAKSASGFHVATDTPSRFELAASPGPATLAAWGGKLKRRRIPVAWVAIGKHHVSYHLMALDHPAARTNLPKSLAAHLQGKTCFQFRAHDEELIQELEGVTTRGLAAFRKAGFCS